MKRLLVRLVDSLRHHTWFTVGSGGRAEQLAAQLAKKKGLTILAKNVRYHGLGEIDLICSDGIATIFVEVRLRRNRQYNPALLTVTQRKQRRIKRTALRWLGARRPPIRFDVVAFDALHEQGGQWYEAAFS